MHREIRKKIWWSLREVHQWQVQKRGSIPQKYWSNNLLQNYLGNAWKENLLIYKMLKNIWKKSINNSNKQKRKCKQNKKKTKNSDIIIEKNPIWAEYISELFEDHRKDNNVMRLNFAGSPTVKDEIWAATRQMKSGKITGQDSISVEL